jgi:hypothetical protein
MTLGWLLILFVGGLGVALALGLLRTRRISRQPEHLAREDEATRAIYDDANRRSE